MLSGMVYGVAAEYVVPEIEIEFVPPRMFTVKLERFLIA